MILRVFSLFDTKSGIYTMPFFMAHVGQAVRACIELGRDNGTTVGRHPADFALVVIGEFDDQVGVLKPTPHENLGSVVSFLDVPRAGDFALVAQ